MITKLCFKSRSMFKAVFSVGKNKVDTTTTPLKHEFDLNKLYKLKECLNDANLGFLDSMLKSPRIIWVFCFGGP